MKSVTNESLYKASKDIGYVGQKLFLIACNDSRVPNTDEFKDQLIKILEETLQAVKESKSVI